MPNAGGFKKGHDARRNTNGRPQCGKSKALALVDSICNKAKNLTKLKQAMQAEFDKDPLAFFQNIVVPLTPKQNYNLIAPVIGEWATKTPSEIVRDMTADTLGVDDGG